MSKKLSPSELYAFQNFVDLVSNLNDVFTNTSQQKVKALNLYYRLLAKIPMKEVQLIEKQLSILKEFCIVNRSNIEQRESLTSPLISLTDRIYIDVNFFINKSEEENKLIIWEYLLILSASLDDKSSAKSILNVLENDTQQDVQQNLTNILQNVSDSDGLNPAMLSQLMDNPLVSQFASNPLVSQVMGNLLSGPDALDLKQISSSVQTVMGTVMETLEKSDDPEIQKLLKIAETMKQP